MSKMSIAINRFGLGWRSGDTTGSAPQEWLRAQLADFDPRPAPIASAPSMSDALSKIAELRQSIQDQRRAKAKTGGQDGPRPKFAQDMVKSIRQTGNVAYVASAQARLEAALVTPTPFAERLVHFWSNHFAISADKNKTVAAAAGAFEFDAIRPHVMGAFSDMVIAVEQHPAMILFLDQQNSVGPNSPLLKARKASKAGINENLGREALELHTMGARSGYTQDDVIALSKALTGWTFVGAAGTSAARFIKGGRAGEFAFVEEVHEPGAHTLLGKSYPESGAAQAIAMLRDAAAHPKTAEHIATKLARHFAGDSPPPALVGRLKAAYLETDGHLPALYEVLISAPECWSEEPVKFKTPWEWTVSAMRALGKTTYPGPRLIHLLDRMGQPVWSPGSPAGFDDFAAAWLSPDTLLRRVGTAAEWSGAVRAAPDARELAAQLFPDERDLPVTQSVARAQDPAEGLAILLTSPQMLRR